ncbi:MAG: ABC transporter substrate-binding protein [Kiritimatiellaeota bacterium]|nr:ABC transporter substrate-binding protein [Kiritimatiellota bacterium]
MNPRPQPLGRAGAKAACTIACGPIILVCVLGFLFGGCGVGTSDRGPIRFWNGFTGPDGRTMLRLVKRFNCSNTGPRVLMQRMDWGTYYNKLMVAGIGGRAPDVFVVHVDVLQRFMRTSFVRPMDDLFTKANGLDPADFDPNVRRAVTRHGRPYGVPLDVHILGMYYNVRLFRDAGIVDAAGRPRPPTNREEFLAAARRLTRDTDGDGRIDQWGFVFTWFRTNVYAVMAQFGGKFFSADGRRCLIAGPQNVAALQFCADLIHKYRVAPSPQNFDSWIGFRQGRVGMAFEGVYMLGSLEKQTDLDYAGAPLPVLGGEPASWAGSHVLCLRADLRGERLKTAWRLVRFLSDNSLDWAAGGQIPVRRSLRNTARFRSMRVQAQFARQLPNIRYGPAVPFIFEFYSEFDTAVDKALRGTASPAQALREAAERIDRIIEREQALAEQAPAGRSQ